MERLCRPSQATGRTGGWGTTEAPSEVLISGHHMNDSSYDHHRMMIHHMNVLTCLAEVGTLLDRGEPEARHPIKKLLE